MPKGTSKPRKPSKGVDSNKQIATKKDLQQTVENSDYKHLFSDGEINENARQMAAANKQLEQIMLDKKAVVIDYTSKIDAKKSEINELSTQINNGFEMRHGTCIVIKDFAAGKKRFYLKNDPNNLIREENLTAADHQLTLPVEDK